MKKTVYILLLISLLIVAGCSNESETLCGTDDCNESITVTPTTVPHTTTTIKEKPLQATGQFEVTYSFNDSNFELQTINLTLYQSYLDFYHNHPVNESLSDEEFYNSFYQYNYSNYLYNQIIDYAKNYSDNEEKQIDYLMRFVSSIDYKYVNEFYYPYELIYNGYGACTDKSMFMVGLLNVYNYSTALLVFNKSNHLAVGIKCTTPQYDDYCFMDVTNSFQYLTNDDLILNNNETLFVDDYKVIKISDGKIYNSDDERSLLLSLKSKEEEYYNLMDEFEERDSILNALDDTNFEDACKVVDGIYITSGILKQYVDVDNSISCNDAYDLYNTNVERINSVISQGKALETELLKYPEFISFNNS